MISFPFLPGSMWWYTTNFEGELVAQEARVGAALTGWFRTLHSLATPSPQQVTNCPGFPTLSVGPDSPSCGLLTSSASHNLPAPPQHQTMGFLWSSSERTKHCWFSSPSSLLVIWMEWWLLCPLHDRLQTGNLPFLKTKTQNHQPPLQLYIGIYEVQLFLFFFSLLFFFSTCPKTRCLTV